MMKGKKKKWIRNKKIKQKIKRMRKMYKVKITVIKNKNYFLSVLKIRNLIFQPSNQDSNIFLM